MANVTIIYGSSTGNTESAANDIAAALSSHTTSVMDVSGASASDFEGADLLILGTSTWGLGDIQDDWDGKLSSLEGANLAGKKVAIFGCGDSASFGDTFARRHRHTI
ncbi:MAG: flavodoxin domain-containing protein [Rikenellaceae bacterium]